jgi:hypothetical protein
MRSVTDSSCANIDFWTVQLNGGDRLVLDMSGSTSSPFYHFELYAPGTTDGAFSATPPVDVAQNFGTTPDQLTLQAPYTGKFILAVCQWGADDPPSCQTADSPGGAPPAPNAVNPMNPTRSR